MNKIVIIGNGFDLAHGLPTGYGDFMNYIADSIIELDKNGHVVKQNGIEHRYIPEYRSDIVFSTNSHSNIVPTHVIMYLKVSKNRKIDPWIGARINNGKVYLEANPSSNSIYFQSLFENYSKFGKWSDLETHYFGLIETQSEIINKQENAEAKIPYIKKVRIINKEFEHLKTLLKEYLIDKVEDKICSDCTYKTDYNNSILKMLLASYRKGVFKDGKIDVISFNYTGKILTNYVSFLKRNGVRIPIEPIHIHGDLLDEDNPIIFGYGDDNSETYRNIQNSKINELLENFKTFKYLRSNRYRQVLGLLEESENIYVQVIGHSLDLSDRTLLKTIFQHPNVKHIEVTYYDKEENYFENLYNISRIFDENTIMREKLIPLEDTYKIDSKELPKIDTYVNKINKRVKRGVRILK